MRAMSTRNTRERWRFRWGDERGSILVVTLIVLAILTALCVQLGRNVRARLDLVRRLENREELRAAARNGARICVASLLGDGEVDATICVGRDRRLNAGYEDRGERWRAEAVYIDEESKINVNTADIKVMAALFEIAAGIDEDAALELAYRVDDWRDKDSDFGHPQHGAEDGEYRRTVDSYEAKDAPFEVVEEISLVLGMSAGLFEKVRDYLTVYGTGKVNVNNAPRPVLRALGLSDAVAGAIESYRLRYDPEEDVWTTVKFTDPSTIIADLSGFATIPEKDLEDLSKVVAAGMLITTSEHYAVRSVGTSDDGIMRSQVVSVVSRRDRRVLYWRDELAGADSVRLWKARGQ